MLPSQFKPKTAADFIGSAGRYALMMQRIVAMSAPDELPIKILLNGPPGVGKSELTAFLAAELRSQPYNRTKLNGTSVKMEWLEDLAASLRLSNWFDDYRFIWIDEADKIPAAAQVRFLTLLDDLPKKTAVICTSNCELKDFENRFQTRFVTMELEAAPANEVYDLLARLFGPDAVRHDLNLRRIAEFSCGNVRQALLDGDALVLAS
jgi:replication-associated recombination protein RarA